MWKGWLDTSGGTRRAHKHRLPAKAVGAVTKAAGNRAAICAVQVQLHYTVELAADAVLIDGRSVRVLATLAWHSTGNAMFRTCCC